MEVFVGLGDLLRSRTSLDFDRLRSLGGGDSERSLLRRVVGFEAGTDVACSLRLGDRLFSLSGRFSFPPLLAATTGATGLFSLGTSFVDRRGGELGLFPRESLRLAPAGDLKK